MSSSNRISEEDILFNTIKQDTEFHKAILGLAMIENDEGKLKEMLYGLEIKDKRLLTKDLRNYLESDEGLKEESKQKYLETIDENEQLYNDIEDVICTKIGVESIETLEDYKLHEVEGVRDTVNDFKESAEFIMIRANLKSISNSQKIIQREAQALQITEDNAKEALKLLNEIVDTSAGWLKYLRTNSNKGKFDLLEKEYWELMDQTITDSKNTLEVVEEKRQQIAEDFPDIAKEVDDEDPKVTRQRRQREEHDDGEER